MEGGKKRKKLIYIVAIGIMILFFQYFRGIDRMWENKTAQSICAVENAVKKSAILCYALEGAYPPSIEYMKENYGLIVNESEYYYHYETFGANIMPKIKVIKKWN